uniref:Uncharacterized protein n=1 Tax=Utricularia reniformis TaxID=192314 RepID=A0A1Y0B3E0_9LAMI|nr:hypothetical protein AEK19_MT1794 [Utricularia reniformis]ART31966.1 hypothetical protein AEK19_MT1794 [Utricularia reniformis]
MFFRNQLVTRMHFLGGDASLVVLSEARVFQLQVDDSGDFWASLLFHSSL